LTFIKKSIRNEAIKSPSLFPNSCPSPPPAKELVRRAGFPSPPTGRGQEEREMEMGRQGMIGNDHASRVWKGDKNAKRADISNTGIGYFII